MFIFASQPRAQNFCDLSPTGQITRPAPGARCNSPPHNPISSNFGKRNIPNGSTWHRGTDFCTPCGVEIAGPPPGCVNAEGGTTTSLRNGYGYTARFDCGNGIQIQYAHLQSANSYNPRSNLITTGGTGSGGKKVFGCHLDYVLTIDGKAVDAQCATGTSDGNYIYGNSSTRHNQQCPNNGKANLCDDATRQALRDHADRVFSGSDGQQNYDVTNGSTSSGGTSTNPDNVGTVDTGPSTYVFLGTGTVGGGGPDVDEDVPDTDVGNDPEEEEDDPDDPADEYDQETSTPRCENSTCITTKMISTANNDEVDWKKVEANTDIIEPPKEGEESECIDPRPTGFDVRKQIPGDRITYEDAFCTQQGCTYVREGDEGKCVK